MSEPSLRVNGHSPLPSPVGGSPTQRGATPAGRVVSSVVFVRAGSLRSAPFRPRSLMGLLARAPLPSRRAARPQFVPPDVTLPRFAWEPRRPAALRAGLVVVLASPSVWRAARRAAGFYAA